MSELAVSLDEYFGAEEVEEEPVPVVDTEAQRVASLRVKALLQKVNAWKMNYGLDKAACVGLTNGEETSADFYPEDDASRNPAKLVCNACPEQDACLRVALERNEKTGIWGGAAPNERRNIRSGYKRHNIAKTGESLGDYAVRQRSRYIEPADPLGVFDSRRQHLLRVQADALCLTEERNLFELLDTGHTDEYVEEMLVEATEVCKGCVNFARGCTGGHPLTEGSLPTVFGGVVVSL